MPKIYTVSFYGSFSGSASVTAKSEEEAYEIAQDLAEEFYISTATSDYDIGGDVNEVTIEDVEEEEQDYEDDVYDM